MYNFSLDNHLELVLNIINEVYKVGKLLSDDELVRNATRISTSLSKEYVFLTSYHTRLMQLNHMTDMKLTPNARFWTVNYISHTT